MNVSLNWLKEYVYIDIQSDALANKFNLMSAEVERLYKMVNASNLVVGHVLACVKHPDSDHLHVCTVDIGTIALPIVCGAGNVAAGQKVIVALDGAILPGNLKIKKSKIRGVVSNGMICSLDELGIEHKYHQEDGIHVLPASTEVGIDAIKALHFDDEIIELHLTPNRGDLLSMIGVAYDVSAMIETKLHLDEPKVNEIKEKNPVKVSTLTDGCMSYYARVIKNIKIQDSPDWMKARLIAAGVRPINNVVDITNYVMLEYGQPLHAFDFDNVETAEIVIRNALLKEDFVTLDGKNRILTQDDLVITNGKKVIALAGVMGGVETEISDKTVNVLLESATFNPILIRKTAKRLDLHSEASTRFERRLDPNRTIMALDRACMLLESLAAGSILSGIAFFDNNDLMAKPIEFSTEQITKVTGYHYQTHELESVFQRLHFDFQRDEDKFVVFAPTRRPDISTYQDLIEEVVRIHGFQFIPVTMTKLPSSGYLTPKQQIRRLIRNTLVFLGLDETLTYSLVSETQAIEFDKKAKSVVRLLHPMAEDRGCLRHTLIPSLLDVSAYNISRKADRIALFEIGKGYSLAVETEFVAGVISGTFQESLWQGKKEVVDFFLVKGLIEALCDRIGITNIRFTIPKNPYPKLHPTICACIKKDDVCLGWMGKLHPVVQTEHGLPDTFVFSLKLDKLVAHSSRNFVMKSISKYPAVTRDIAIVVDKTITAATITDLVRKAGKKTLDDVKIFDIYQGEKINSNQKSIALSLTFQDYDKTLETEEIDQMTTKIIKCLETELQAILRT
ncbi:MAG: phenylalanine--tRNA ligase subunit beta [Candidatus Izemoplasmatales bacterium]|jgi:phenylalanyl-tRNA synthetase beta chain